MAGQVSTRPGRADQLRPRRPRLAPGTRRHSAASLRLPAPSRPVPVPRPGLHPPGGPWGGPTSLSCQDPAQAPDLLREAPGGVPSSGLLASLASALAPQRLPTGPLPSCPSWHQRASCFSFCSATWLEQPDGPGPERGLVRKGKASGSEREREGLAHWTPIQDRTRLSSADPSLKLPDLLSAHTQGLSLGLSIHLVTEYPHPAGL